MPNPFLPNFTLQPEPNLIEEDATQYEYADLQAQENMARATNWIAWFSLFGFLTASVGVGLLIYNIKAVGETNQIMRDEQRPWLSVSVHHAGEVMTFRHREQERGFVTPVKVCIKNHGSKPCFAFHFTDHEQSIFEFDPAKNVHVAGFQEMPMKVVIFPGETHETIIMAVSELPNVSIAPSATNTLITSGFYIGACYAESEEAAHPNYSVVQARWNCTIDPNLMRRDINWTAGFKVYGHGGKFT
jgi:hypothetical protein